MSLLLGRDVFGDVANAGNVLSKEEANNSRLVISYTF